jgi:hypothetical protein
MSGLLGIKVTQNSLNFSSNIGAYIHILLAQTGLNSELDFKIEHLAMDECSTDYSKELILK